MILDGRYKKSDLLHNFLVPFLSDTFTRAWKAQRTTYVQDN